MSDKKEYHGLDHGNEAFRAIDNTLCPKDAQGEISATCHSVHCGYHWASQKIDKAFGGDGSKDQARMDYHCRDNK